MIKHAARLGRAFFLWASLGFALAGAGRAAAQEAGFVLVEIEYSSPGLVRHDALDAFFGVEPGRAFADVAALENWIAELERAARNDRRFDPATRFRWEPLGEVEAGVAVPFRLVGEIEMSWNALAVPFPKYSDDTGFVLALRYKDFNFLGSLQTLSVDLDLYGSDGRTNAVVEGSLPFDLPSSTWTYALAADAWYVPEVGFTGKATQSLSTSFAWSGGGADWTLAPRFSYQFDAAAARYAPGISLALGAKPDWALPFAFTGAASYGYEDAAGVPKHAVSGSLGASLPFELGLPWTATAGMGYAWEDVAGVRKGVTTVDAGLSTDFEALIAWTAGTNAVWTDTAGAAATRTFRSGASIAATVDAGRLAGSTLTLVPSIELYSLLDAIDGSLDDLGFKTSLAWSGGRVDLDGNFRRGAQVSIGNAFILHPLEGYGPTLADWRMDWSASVFGSVGNLMGWNIRALGTWYADWTCFGKVPVDTAEEPMVRFQDEIRGAKGELKGDVGAVLNLELPVNFAQGKFFDSSALLAEVHAVPFLDAGYVRADPTLAWDDSGNFQLGAGIDMIIYPERARAFTYRLSVGYDLKDLLSTRDFKSELLEIWLGLGLHF